MQNYTSDQIVSIHLKYSTNAKPLKTLAYAELISKILFFSKNPLNQNELSIELARATNFPRLPEDMIRDGLSLLAEDKKIQINNDKYSLDGKTRSIIKNEIESLDIKLDELLSRHFPLDIEQSVLRKWFLVSTAKFFSFYSSDWIKSACKKGAVSNFQPTISLEEMLKSSIETAKLSDKNNGLVRGFGEFLASDVLSDQEYIMNLGMAAFSARLITVEVGVDPIAFDELKNTKFILDTNFLISIALETKIGKMLNSLEDALALIDAKLVILYETREEYSRIISLKREETLELLQIYPFEVFSRTDDDFIKAAIKLGCASQEDFDRFFDSIADAPKKIFKKLPIQLEDDEVIKKVTDNAKKDLALKKKIQQYRIEYIREEGCDFGEVAKIRRTKVPKGEAALNHDASLIYVTEFLRKSGQKSLTLSFDKTLYFCSSERSNSTDVPSVMIVDTLIQLLAINVAGPGHKPEDFAPLLAKILLTRCLPHRDTYNIKDLVWMHQLNERVVDFSPEKIDKIARTVAKHRMSGSKITEQKFVLDLNRLYQEEKLDFDAKIQEATDRVRKAEEKAAKEEKDKEEAIDKAIVRESKTIISDSRRSMTGKIVVGSLCFLILLILVFVFRKILTPPKDQEELFSYVSNSISFVGLPGGMIGFIIKAIIDHRKRTDDAFELAVKRVRSN